MQRPPKQAATEKENVLLWVLECWSARLYECAFGNMYIYIENKMLVVCLINTIEWSEQAIAQNVFARAAGAVGCQYAFGCGFYAYVDGIALNWIKWQRWIELKWFEM